MATWKSENSMLTLIGEDILNKLKVGQGSITITRIVLGSGRVSQSSLLKQTQISGVQKSCVINGFNTRDGGSEISFYISNENFIESYNVNQIGVYVTHPDYSGEQLYHISQCEESDFDTIPAFSANSVTLEYSLFLTHGNSSSVVITADPEGMVNRSEFETFKSEYTENQEHTNNSITILSNSQNTLNTSFSNFKSGIKQGMLVTPNDSGNLIASGKSAVRGYPLSVTDAMAHRALSLSIEGKTTQTATPTVSTPVYPTNSLVKSIRHSDGVNAAKFISFPSTIELRSLGDYKDTIEWDGAKWWKVQRIQELVADGTNVTVYSSEGNSSQTYCRFGFNRGTGYNLVKDHITSAPIITSHGNTVSNTAEFYALNYSSSNTLCGHFLNTVTGVTTTQTSAEKGATINAWLQAQNTAGKPVKVYYVLKTPIVTEISLTTVLEMYANKTDMSCTYEGNAPTMELAYALNTTDATTMYILNRLARKSEVATANTFAEAIVIS